MTPQRRGILVTLLVLGLTLGVGLGIVLAAGMSAKPDNGPRDNGNNVQTSINLSGDLDDGPNVTWSSQAQAYWDLPNPNVPNSSYVMTINGPSPVANDGTFNFNTEVPLYDDSLDPVRPGDHVITVCAFRGRSPVCTSDGFKVQNGTAVLSKSEGRQGSPLTITGTRWVPENAKGKQFASPGHRMGQISMSSATTGPSTWSHSFSVPGLPAGEYQIRICNVSTRSGDCVAADSVLRKFTITGPKLTLSKSTGVTGSPFDFSGDNFFPNSTFAVYFGPKGSDSPTDPGVHPIGPTGSQTDGNGDFGPFTYTPSEGPGEYTVIACTLSRTCNSLDVAQKPYTITAPTASPSPTKSPSPTPSPTKSPSPTPTPTPTVPVTAPPTASPTASASPTLTPTPSTSPSPTVEPTVVPASAPPTASPTPTPETTPDETEEPTAGPTASPTPSDPPSLDTNATWPEHLHSPGQLTGGGLDLATIGSMGLLALLIAFLVPFPGTLFNKTVEANYTEIMGWMAGLKRRWTSFLNLFAIGPLGGVRRFLGRLVTGRLGVLVFLGMSALVYSFLSPTFGFDTNSLALFLGLMVGLGFITAAFDLPLRIYHGRTSKAHDRGVLRALWWTLLVAVICVIVSRLSNFQPGYLYGLVVSIVFVTEISTRDEGLGTWLASTWLIILSFVAWVLLAFVRQGAGFDPWVSLFMQTVLVTFVVAGIETLAVGLLPMRFLPGHPLYQWRRGMWFFVFALSVMGYLLILVDPANGYLSDDSRTPMLVGAIFLVTFGIVSLGTWAYFRFRPARPGLDRPGEAPTA